MQYNVLTKRNGVKFAVPKYSKESELAERETNDCFVRAIASCFNLHYDKAHSWVKKNFNRQDRKGTMGVGIRMQSHKTLWGRKITELGDKVPIHRRRLQTTYKLKGKIIKRKMTIGTFLKKFPSGTYLMLVHQHAFCIKEGVIIGNKEDADRLRVRIEHVFKIG